jgi:hypothetical protein
MMKKAFCTARRLEKGECEGRDSTNNINRKSLVDYANNMGMLEITSAVMNVLLHGCTLIYTRTLAEREGMNRTIRISMEAITNRLRMEKQQQQCKMNTEKMKTHFSSPLTRHSADVFCFTYYGNT